MGKECIAGGLEATVASEISREINKTTAYMTSFCELLGAALFVVFTITSKKCDCIHLPCVSGCKHHDWLEFAVDSFRSMFWASEGVEFLLIGLCLRSYFDFALLLGFIK